MATASATAYPSISILKQGPEYKAQQHTKARVSGRHVKFKEPSLEVKRSARYTQISNGENDTFIIPITQYCIRWRKTNEEEHPDHPVTVPSRYIDYEGESHFILTMDADSEDTEDRGNAYKIEKIILNKLETDTEEGISTLRHCELFEGRWRRIIINPRLHEINPNLSINSWINIQPKSKFKERELQDYSFSVPELKKHFKSIRSFNCLLCRKDAWSETLKLDRFDAWLKTLTKITDKTNDFRKSNRKIIVTVNMMLMYYCLHKDEFDEAHPKWELIDRMYMNILRTIHVIIENSGELTPLLQILTNQDQVSAEILRDVLPAMFQLSLKETARDINKYKSEDRRQQLYPEFILNIIENNDVTWLFNIQDEDDTPPENMTYRRNGILTTDFF